MEREGSGHEILREGEQPIREALRRCFRDLGHGSIRQATRALGWHGDRLYKLLQGTWRKGGMFVGELRQIASAAGIPLPWILDRAFGEGRLAADRFIAEGRKLLYDRRKDLPTVKDGVTRAPNQLDQSTLKHLDDLRFIAPDTAAEEARLIAQEAARDGRFGDMIAAVTRQGSALALLADYHGAHACFVFALHRLPNARDRANLWLRTSYLASEYGDFKDAIQLTDQSLIEAARQGDAGSVGQAVFARATFEYYRGDLESSWKDVRGALELLAESDRRHRCAAHQLMAVLTTDFGDLDRASEYLHQAVSIEVPPGTLGARLYWLQARIEERRKRFDRAEKLYIEAVARIAPSPVDTVLATCDLTRLYLARGRVEDAAQLVQGMVKLAEPIANRRIATEVFQLSCAALEGLLNVTMVARTIERISKAATRARRAARPVMALGT